ncbi:MAG: hypothetical protein HQ478_02630 [Chloroflexi bacterium]|nr:hypothetical protein [Chloroflexota bacterium]
MPNAVAAGALGGILFALIFVGHMSIAVFYRMPDAIERRFQAEDSAAPTRVIFWGIFALIPTLGLLGIGLAALSVILTDLWDTGFPPVPSVPFLIGVLMITVSTAPVAASILHRIRKDVLAEYALFAAIFGVMIPWLANS